MNSFLVQKLYYHGDRIGFFFWRYSKINQFLFSSKFPERPNSYLWVLILYWFRSVFDRKITELLWTKYILEMTILYYLHQVFMKSITYSHPSLSSYTFVQIYSWLIISGCCSIVRLQIVGLHQQVQVYLNRAIKFWMIPEQICQSNIVGFMEESITSFYAHYNTK